MRENCSRKVRTRHACVNRSKEDETEKEQQSDNHWWLQHELHSTEDSRRLTARGSAIQVRIGG